MPLMLSDGPLPPTWELHVGNKLSLPPASKWLVDDMAECLACGFGHFQETCSSHLTDAAVGF